MKREYIAIHEAGHMVVALYAGLSPRKVTIAPESDSLGHVLMRRYSKRFEEACQFGSLSSYMANRLDKIIQVTLAGSIAEKKLRGRWNHVGAREDRDAVIDLGRYRFPWESPAFDQYINRMYAVTEDVVNDRWPEIEAVKDALLDHETLSRQQVDTVLEDFISQRN